MPRAFRALALLFAGLALAPCAGVAADNGSDVRSTVPLPGGAAALSDALGSPHAFDRAVVLLEAARLLHENPPGESPETDRRRRLLVEYLRAVGQAKHPAALKDETIPLPLTPAIWSDAVFDRRVKDSEIAFAILEDRQAALLYCGLSALDDETLAYLATDRRTLTKVYRLHAAAFAAFGRSLHVRNGEVQVPGGADARPLWEELAQHSTHEPGLFLQAILETNAGRLAFFFDTMAHASEPAQRYALGLDVSPMDARLLAVQTLYEVFASSYPGWLVTRRPFSRAALDGDLILRWLRFDGNGRLVGPMWPPLVERAFAELPAVLVGTVGGEWLPDDPEGAVAGLDPTQQIDAARLADRLLSPLPQIGRQRLDALLFGQRVFPRPSPKDAASILLAMRGRIVFPGLVATLERMGVTEPAFYAAAVSRASDLMAIGDPEPAASALAGFQASTAILDRATRERTLSPAIAQALFGSLVALKPDPSRGYAGAIARWLDQKLLPELWRATGESIAASSAETAVLKALAGQVSDPDRRLAVVEWEGREYAVDRGAAQLARLKSLRRSQGGNDLDRVLAFCRAVAEAIGAGSGESALSRDVAAVREAGRGLVSPALVPRAALAQPFDATAAIGAALDRANAGDRHGATEALRSLVAYGDALLADALTSIAYAPCLGAPDGPALVGGNVALRHDFGLRQKRAVPWQVPAGWALPTEDPAGGWHVDGSLLTLDVALARLALRFLSADAMPPMPLLNGNERRTFAETVVLINPHELSDADRDRLADGIGRGRRRVEALVTNPDSLDQIATEAHLSEQRRQALRWTLVHDPAAASRSFSLLDALWLGGGGVPTAWGMSAMPTVGCPSTQSPDPGAWEEFGGRPMSGLLSTRLPDLTLRAAQELRARGLPSTLLPDILAVASMDLGHEAQPAHHDDWLAIARYVQELPAERFTDYISSLTANGPLVPADQSRAAEGAR
jgi:hypothetical protein